MIFKSASDRRKFGGGRYQNLTTNRFVSDIVNYIYIYIYIVESVHVSSLSSCMYVLFIFSPIF